MTLTAAHTGHMWTCPLTGCGVQWLTLPLIAPTGSKTLTKRRTTNAGDY